MSTVFDLELREMGGGFLPPKPEIEFLYRIVVHCESPIELGEVFGGSKRIIPIIGGRFEGPSMQGTVLAVGADWNTSLPSDAGQRRVDTRYILKTNDHAIIGLSTWGFSSRSPQIMAMRAAGRHIDPSSYYFKQHLFFETSAKQYLWLNSVVAFGIVMSKHQGGPGVIYDAYVLK